MAMLPVQKLSALISEIDTTIYNRFGGSSYWIKAEIADVKKYVDKRWCFLKFIEKEGNNISAEIKGVFWSNTYQELDFFEQQTQQIFASGLEITCNVRVRFHKRFGLTLEVMAIDVAFAVGQLELERKRTLEKLVSEHPHIQLQANGSYSTANNRLPLPTVLQRIALIAPPNSDGQRDFKEVIEKNKYGYAFEITEFLTRVQGDLAAGFILVELEKIKKLAARFDLVVIVRGGGSDIDFKSFNTYELAAAVAAFPLPVLTGIGHDRNTSIVDMMARQLKTPTEVASFIIDTNMAFEQDLLQLKERFFGSIKTLLERTRQQLAYSRRIIKSSSPQTILNRGFAMVLHQQRIITDPALLQESDQVQVVLKPAILHVTITKKELNGTENEF